MTAADRLRALAAQAGHVDAALEWLHYLGTKQIPHGDGKCELCDKVQMIRDAIVALQVERDAYKLLAADMADALAFWLSDDFREPGAIENKAQADRALLSRFEALTQEQQT